MSSTNQKHTPEPFENLELSEFGPHTIKHHTGSRRDEEAKRRMEAFALMREELHREREIKADMLAAMEAILARLGTDPMQDDELAETLRAAIRKARNQSKGE